MKKKVLIAEPSQIISIGLSSIIEENINYKIVGIVTDFKRIEEKIISLQPDILIVNPLLIETNYIISSSNFFKEYSNLCIVALYYQYVAQSIFKLYDAIIDIQSSKVAIIESLDAALKSKKEDDKPISDNYELTDRERDVLVLVAQGYSSREIAEKLSISTYTVISHRKNITRKTSIKSVAGLAVYAVINNLIDPSEINI